MNGYDSFFSKPLLIQLRQDKSIDILAIKKEIKNEYKLNIVDAIKDYQKFHAIMQKLYGNKATRIEKNLINSITKIEHIGSEVWVSTDETTSCMSIIDSFGDPFKRVILNITKNDDRLVLKLLKDLIFLKLLDIEKSKIWLIFVFYLTLAR